MKLTYLLAIIAGTAFFASLVLNPSFGHLLSRMGKHEFYAYVVDPGKRTLASLSAKAGKKRFVYSLPAIDVHGAEKALTFIAPEQLSLDTYVRLYVSSAGTVTAWEEVPTQDLPKRISHGQVR